jgi:hypothetical protein
MTSKELDLEIKPLKDNRDNIKLNKLMKDGTIPTPGNCVFVGRTKSGKSVCIANILLKKHMYKGYFDIIYLFCLSPARVLIDNLKELDEQNVFTDGDPSKLNRLLEIQKDIIDKKGFKKAPSILVIADDMASEPKFMNSSGLRTVFFSGSHHKIYCWITTQSYVKLPRSMRLNADSLFLFHGLTSTEVDRFSEEHRPPQLNKKQFKQLCDYTLKKAYSFMFCNCCVADKTTKFRKGFSEILKITS